MADTDTTVVRLSDLAHGQEAICFAALLKKEPGTDKHGKPFLKCHFRDKRVTLVAPFWSGNALREVAETWADGFAYRLHLRGDRNIRYGMQIRLSGSDSGRGPLYCWSPGAPRGRQAKAKFRFRSTPWAFWRMSTATPSGLRSRTIQMLERDGMRP